MKRIAMLILSAVLIAAVMSGCVQKLSEIGTPDVAPPTATPDVAPPAPTSGVAPPSVPVPPIIANWNYVSYRNLSISNAPALDQTARIAYSIIPDKDIEILFVHLDIPDGFELMDVEGEWPQTWHNLSFSDVNDARWFPTNLSKDKLYQFSATIKAVKTGNWTITGLDWEDRIYLSVSEDSACISDKPFPKSPEFPVLGRSYVLNKSELEKMRANISITPSKYNITPRPLDISEIKPPNLDWNNHYWNGTTWMERKNQS